MMFRTNADELRREIAPLHLHYPGQWLAQKAYVEMWRDRDGDWRLTADSNGEIGNAIPFTVVHRQAFRWDVPGNLRGTAIANILESDDVQDVVARIAAGWDDKWDGNNLVGVLTEDAEDAVDEMGRLLDELTDVDYDNPMLVPIYDAMDWAQDLDVSSGNVDALVAEQEAIVARDQVLIDGDLRSVIEAKVDSHKGER